MQCGRDFLSKASRVGTYCSRTCRTERFNSRPEIEKRFWAQVQKTPGCWLWAGFKLNSGYGITSTHRRRILAHRLSYKLAFGDIPKGMHVCHKCDTPLCVRPEHLFTGTDADNHADMKAKWRHTYGERARHKLTEAQVIEIKRDFHSPRNRRSNAKALAAKYGVNVGAIYNVVRGATWSHIP